MPKRTSRIGGFAAQNSGTIKNCYSVVRLNTKGQISGGFAGENSANISHSYSYCRLRGLTGGFAGDNGGDTEENCYYLHNEKAGSKRLQKLSDSLRGQRLKELKKSEDAARLGFDMEAVWEFKDTGTPLPFIAEHWMFDVQHATNIGRYAIPLSEDMPTDESDVEAEVESTGIQVIAIRDPEGLWELAQHINDGDQELAASFIRLEADIDLGGKEWLPIGNNRTYPFTGIFDGQGYTIKNFVIKNKKVENKGFFGFVNGGEVYNLSVDCIIRGGTCCGGLIAQNEGGIVGCCSAVIYIKGKKGSFGGLVGRNTGTIFQSYSAGIISAAIIPIWWLLIPLSLLILLLLFLKPASLLPTFAPVPYDKDAIPIPGESIMPSTDENFVSFQFKQEITVPLDTGLCKFEFKNPGNSNHNIVVQLQFTDAQAVRVMGSTGRSQTDQQKLDDTPGYDPENYRTVIAESGSIQPGYQMEELRMVNHSNGATIPPGKYNAMVYLVFYDIETNNRAMLESQLPVVIEVVPSQ